MPSVAALVEAMFMAEIGNGLPTAGHALDQMIEPIRLDVASGSETCTLLNGRVQAMKPGDMILTDARGVVCSVIFGLDRHTSIRRRTKRVLFVVYAPECIDAACLRRLLQAIRDNVLVISPHASVEVIRVYDTWS